MVTCGESLEEALFLMHNLVSACESQIKLLPIGLDNISIMSDEAVQQVRSVVKTSGTQVQGKPDQDPSSPVKGDYLDRVKKWKVWDLEFEAQMRMLDNAVSSSFLFFFFFPPSPTLFPFLQLSECQTILMLFTMTFISFNSHFLQPDFRHSLFCDFSLFLCCFSLSLSLSLCYFSLSLRYFYRSDFSNFLPHFVVP